MKPFIKVKPNIKDTFGPAKHDKPPVTRREFIARGMMAGTSTLFLPSVFDLVSIRNALGATNACSSLQMPSSIRNVSALVIDATGGMSLSACVRPMAGTISSPVPYDISTATQALGIGPADTFDSNLVKGLQLRMGDSFYSTLMTSQNAGVPQATLNAALALTSGYAAPLAGENNDTSSNPQNMAPHINALSNGSMFVSSVIGKLNSVAPAGIKYSVLNVQKPSDLTGTVGFLDSILTNTGMVNALTNTTNQLSQSQQNAILSRRSFGSQLSALLQGSVTTNNQYGDPCFSNLFDPTKLSYLSNAFNLSTKAARIAILHALHQRYAAVATMQVGGADYHDGTSTSNAQIHTNVASIVQDWLVSSHLEAMNGGVKTSVCFIISDGACAMGYNGGQQAIGNNDRAEHAMVVGFVYNAAGAVNLRHLNVMTSAESADSSTNFGKMGPPAAVASACTLYGVLSSQGMDSNFNAFMSSAFQLTPSQYGDFNPKV